MAQVNDNDDIKWLYGKLKAKGYNIGSEAEFKSSLANGEDRKWYYEKAKGMGLDMGSMDDFESMYAPKAAPAPKKETPSSGQRKPASAVSASPEQPKQKPKGTPMTEQDKIRMSLQMGQMKQQVQQGIANTNAKIGRMMEPLTQKGRERRRLGEFQARMAGTPTHVVGFNTASPAPAGSGARGGSQQKPVQSEQSPQPYGVKYENGKAKTQWILPDGTLTTSLIEANQAEYEARTARLAHQFQDRMKENGLDPNKPEDVRKQAQLDYEAPMRKAIEDEWQRAEAEDRAADEAYRKDMERAEGGGFWDRLKKSITPLGPDGMPLRRGDETLRDIKRAAKRQDTFNLEKMAQSVLQNMPQEYKDNQMLNYSRYFREHPSELKGRTVSQAAKEALQGEVYHATYERAVQARMPKSKTEFLLRKVADQPFFSQTMSDNMAARLFSHSIGTEAADMDAMGRYGTDHRALDITGTVLNMAIDPTTYISGGVGSFAGKQALKLSGKVALKGASKEAAERYVGRTLAGRMVAGVAAGSANFGTFEGLKNMQQQMRLGGTLNPETGEYEFSAGDMLKATGHGMLLGSVTGTLSPVLGNVSDKLVKATESTAGKVGIRAGELMTSTVAEGTIFATPEWIENAQLADEDPRKRKAMDIWTDNMAMMLGFKVSHGIKSAPQVIAGLRPIAEPKTMEERNHNRRSFAERLRKRMDASPRDLDFTKEEREELRRNGYGDLASLFTRTPKQPNKPKAKPTMTDGKTMTFDVDFQHAKAERVSNPEFDGYEAMERLMQDPNVSQSARAKAYYILTGRMLPMGTVTGYTTNKDANGVTVQAMTAQGEVVTSRHFKTEEEAKKEEANIMRQAELNSVDVGERYKEAAANAKVVQAAVESVAPGADFATVMRNYKAVKEGDKDAIAAYGKMVEDIDRAIEANKTIADGERPEAIRASIKEETGVDVDATLRKEPKNRTEEEQAAVEDYIKRLFPEQKSEEAGASAEAEQPMSEAESAAAAAYDQARLLWDKVEKGDTDAKAEVDAITLRMQEAYQMCEDAFGADAEMRIAEINEDPWPLVNNPELSEDQQDAVLYYVNAKAAMEGVMDASNEAADGKRKEVEANVERHTHKDMGFVQPATMKVDDKPVYVVKGNVVMLPDGSGIDVRNSDQSIVICDAETGEYKFASPDQLFSLGEAIDPQTELDEAYANIQAEHEAVLGVPENGENVQGNGENVPNSAENVSQLTDEQLQQYAHSAFNEATQSDGITIPQEQAEQLQQHNQQMLEQEQQRKEEEANRQPTALERVPINEETGEPMFEKADRETALDALNEITGGNDENTTAIVRAQVEQATKALEALKKKEPTKKAPSLKGSPMAMVKAQQEAEANYNTAMEEYNAQVAAAEENLNAWSRINSLMNDRKRAIREQQEAERKVREEKLHAEAVARLEEDKRIAAEKAAEQEAVGTHAVNPKIKAKWDGATKVEGNPNAITLADGSTIRGHYVLTEAGAATASHDVNNAYEPTEGFPVDENGESVNDRDYKRDKDAQRIVRDMADSYDSRALQTPVIVSKDGVVLSGNNRTMSGDIAAQQGTDKAYIDHLREFGQMYGFTPEQIDGMKHPRVVFVPDEHLPYDATTFARFNAEQQKKQSKPEHAVKLGKIVPDNVFTSITNDISRFDRMSDYYADDKSVASAISQLLDAGVINEMQLPELRTGNALSAAGKELIENTLIGKVFQTSPDAVRQIISTPTLRQSVVMGLNEIANNRTLAKSGYDLSKELAAAVDLVSRAKSDSPEIYKEGMPVSPYGRQQGLFDDEYGDSRVTDGVTLLLADLLNSGKPSDLRKVLSTYNNEAASPAAGQIDMFSGDVTSKEEILKNVNEYFRNATPKEQQALIDAAVAERKRRAEAAEPAGGDEASEQATVVAGSGAEPQQPVVASEEPVKGNEADADALAKEAEEKLSERITDTEDEWTEPSEYGEIYKHRMFVDGKEVIKVDAPDKSKNYPGTYYEIDGKQFGDLYEVANYIDGNEQPLSAKIEAASAEVNTDPTEAQKEAGNYKKGHVQVGTFDITIEQPQGSVRKGTDADGKQWESKMNNTYGYIRGAVGVDGDHIDVFLSNDIDGWNGRKVFVVDQYNPDGSFDEHKVMLGFNDVDDAKSDYLANYESGWENGRRIDVSTVNLEDFEKWIASSKRKTKAFSEYSLVKKETVGNSFDDFVRDSGGEVIPNGVTRSNVINFAERVLEKYPSHTESYGTYNAKRTDVEIPANKLFKSESELFTAKNGNSIAVNDTQAKARYELVAHKDAQGHLKSVSVIKYHDFDYNDEEPLVKSVKKDVVEINAPEEAGYSITPSTYTNKKGKTSDVSLLTFDHDLTADQERAVKEFAKERTGEGRFAPARGWKDRESGGWMFRSEEDARKAAEMVGNEQAVADNQPMTAQELRDAVEPKKPTTKTASKKPANRVESVPTEEPIEPEKPKYEVSDEYWKKHPGKREELKTHRDYNRFVPQVRRELEKMGYRFELDGKELTPEESLALDKQNWESRDVIPGREGHTPFVSNEDIARINAKMAGKWVGEPKEAMESAMSERVTELSERLHTPVRIIRTEEEVAALPSVRQRRMKGSFNPMTGEVTIVVPNNANMADVENTFVHEVVGHDGLRVLFPDEAKLNNALDELYRVSKDEIRGTIDRMAQKMYDAEVDRIREKKRKEHVANGEDANASYYADMAAAHAEAGKKREQFKRDATEEYGADIAGRIGEKGFEKMSAEELTFWGKLKAMLQKALQKLLDGLKIPGKRKWGDKDWAFVLHEAYKRKKNGGKPTVFDAADTEVMRRKTGFGDTKFSDWYKKSAQPNEAALKHLEPIDVEHAAKDNHSPETDHDGGIMFRDGDMGLEETITKMKVEASQANADNWQAKQDAMRAIGGNLNKLRQAMARQREYDLSTVKSITDLAKVLLENGLLDDLSKYETKRILSAVNNVHGKQDVSDYVQKVMDIMVDNQLRMGANQLGKLLSIRGSRVDTRGIEVQGQLDPEGQRIAQVVRKATSLPKENIEERIADCTNRMGSDDNAVAEEAAIEYSGLLLAHQFVEDITESKAEEKALRESIKEAKADLDAGTMEADAYREYVESTNDAIRQNKIERAEAYRSIVEQVGGVLGGSVERAKAWREAEKQRVETIHHNANSDMTGRPNDEHHKESKAQKIANNSIVRFVLAPLGTFDQMLRMFGKKSVNGEGYLWNRYMRGWVEATEKEYTGYQNALKTLDEKVSEVFDKKMKWGDLFSLERNLPKATVTFWDGGEQKAHELTQGNLLYIYMVDKMADGRMKLRRMGITEEDMENIKEFVDPRFLELADWMQDEFLVEKRNEYNEVHKRMFGASMAAIENYFPLKILANARIEEVDVADDTIDTALPATSTGSIIKRRRNNLALDVMGADAFSVILDHIQQMERWASFAEFNRDLNTLLSYKRFRNQVMNMTSVYGGGKTLWKNFRNVCSMAAGAYRPPIAALDKAAVNVAKGVTAAKVSFRVFTALKQFLSMPAYLSDSSPVYLAGNIANPIGAWKWSMENLPLFEKRWKSRMAGDPRLMKSEMDWKMWQNRAVEIASRIGMSPNAFVDALTVAIGAHSMYQTKKKKYLRYGYDEETAEKRAKQDATILFNQTQQSSESAFLSTMQTDRSWLSVLFTVFRNSSMSYTRQLYDALRNLKHRFEPGYKGLTEEYLAKQMRRDGIDPDKADQNAKSEYRRSLMRDIVRVGVFGYLLQFAWNLGAYLPYLLLGDDKDEKSDMWHDIFCHTMFGSIEGLTGGDVMSAVGNGFAKGEGLNLFSASKDMPLSSDLQNIVNKWNKDKVAAMNDVTNLMVQSGIGVNPQSLTDAVVAIMDYCGDDANTSRECALLITRIINCPQSQIDKIYFDELNATAAEAQGMTPAEIAERYARYKIHRGAPLTGWAYTDEARDSVMTAQQNRVLTKAKEKLNSRMETEETKQLLSDYDAVAKQETALSKIKKTDRAAYREGMKQLRQSNDMRQHMRLKRYKHDINELTSKYLRCKSAEERDSIISTMFSTRAKMLEDIGRLKQQ
jgi:PAS domain-containing protein